MSDTLTFEDTIVFDSVPPLADVENPCEKCGKETHWSGRGRRKKYCDDCKPTRATGGSGVRVTGNAANTAAQAAKTLASINSILAMSIGAMGFFKTMKVALDKNEDFEKTAYAALVTDPKLANQILNVGQTSAKITLGIGYLSWGMGIYPTLKDEYDAKKNDRVAAMEDLDT